MCRSDIHSTITEIRDGSLGCSAFFAFLLYSAFHCSACTSIVTTDQSGRIIQGRNLDYIMANILRKIAIQVDFQRGGKVY